MLLKLQESIDNMTQEEKELLLKDLCARLLYGTKVCYRISDKDKYTTETLSGHMLDYFNENSIIEVKPYLRPMSSMTEEELKEFSYTVLQQPDLDVVRSWQTLSIDLKELPKVLDWLNKNMFDYRGLIPIGLGIDCTGLNIYENEKSI